MVHERTYLDYNATAPVWPEVITVVADTLRQGGNASSVYQEGRAARGTIETARDRVASLVGVGPRNVIFTSGGSEANNHALAGTIGPNAVTRLIVSDIEHPSVLEAAVSGTACDVQRLTVDRNGIVQLDQLRKMLGTGSGTALVSVMLANNETGAVQPVADAAGIVHEHGGLLHVDAVQAAGKIAVDFAGTGADLMSLSAHKIGGPNGVGALVIREGLQIDALIRGGGQELGRRAGTENLAGIAGFGVAADVIHDKLRQMADIESARNAFENELGRRVADLTFFSQCADRLPNTSCFSAPGLNAETVVIALDLAGFSVSSGSACSSGKVTRSHVLAAMEVSDDLARGALRVSFGWDTEPAAVDRLTDEWMKVYSRSVSGGKVIAA